MTPSDIAIDSRQWWCPTGLRVRAGDQFRVEILSLDDVNDAGIPLDGLKGCVSDPRHERFAAIPWIKRRPAENYFALIATIDRRHPIRLTDTTPYVAPAAGELVCYFNDAWFAYFNNHGIGRLRLTPIP